MRTIILCNLLVALATAAFMGSCSSGSKSSSSARVDDEYHVIPSHDTMPKVMRSKLAHSQGLMEALALGDFQQMEVNAAALVDISQQADWLVHRTEAYYSLSESFRKAAQSLHEDAGRRTLEAATRDYNALVASCIACHRYLQAERPTLDMPGKVSMTTSAEKRP